MEITYIWWILVAVLVGLEMITGTFYLLMLALGAVAGSLVALLGGGMSLQLLTTSVVAILAVSLWHIYGARYRASYKHVDNNPAVHLDVGQTLYILASDWLTTSSAKVKYRGADWHVRLAHPKGEAPKTDAYYRIVAVQGNTLILEMV